MKSLAFYALILSTFFTPAFAQSSVLVAMSSRLNDGSNVYVRDTVIYKYGMSSSMWDTAVTRRWNAPTATFVNNSRAIRVMDATDSVTMQTNQIWSTTLLAWENVDRFNYTRNPANKMIVILREVFTAGSWKNQQRDLYSYDASSNLIELMQQGWNTSTQAWANGSRYQHTFNGSNQLLSTEWKVFYTNTNNWESQVLWNYAYTNNLQATETVKVWNWQWGQYLNFQVIDKIYSSGLLTSALTKEWVAASSAYVNKTNLVNTYTGTNQMAIARTDVWEPSTSAFVNNKRAVFTYNGNGYLDTSKTETWNASTNAWSFFTTDTLNRYYYQNSTTGVAAIDNAQQKISVFPNPALETITVETSGKIALLRLINLQGSMVATSTAKMIPVASLPPGLYSLLVDDGTSTKAFKVEVRR